ncbi:helix-turn-helix transcriptional regulator [Actinoplanes solisilvae]|uniref:helix-turn-helix transcriptional regulator n=1 Tax=Actinoplanes solisilvae TaxID=2486853 RepID=UPI000FD6E316|nr:LuxR family transcriptional regulator [Actinoplanes solisilvae]
MASGIASSLVDRDVHRMAIQTLLTRSSGACCLFGGPGSGKSVLLDVAADAANDHGVVALRAAGVLLESDVPFAALHQLLLPLRPHFAALPAEHDRTLSSALGFADSDHENSVSVAAATDSLLRHCFVAEPVLLIVDDWQWVDSRSAAVLGAVRCARLIALCAESTPRAADVTGAEPIGLPPLDDLHASRLLHDRCPGIAKRVDRRLLAEAAGNPLALLELAESLSADQRGGRAPLPSVLMTDGRLNQHYTRRVVRLPAPTRHLLLRAALESGSSADLPADGWLPAEQAALGWFDPHDRRWAFRHPMVRSAVLRSATGEERAAAQRELARRATGRPEQQARHLAESTIGPDEAVAQILQDAGHRASEAGDGVGAVTALLRAAELSADGSQRSRRLAEAAYIGANVAGDLRTMPALLTAARDADPDGAGSLPIAVAAAHLLLHGDGHIDTAHRLLSATVDAAVARHTYDDPLLMEALYELADVCFYAARDEMWTALRDTLERIGPGVPALLRIYVQAGRDPASLTASDRMRLHADLRHLDNEQDPTVISRIGRIALTFNRVKDCRAPLARVIDDGRAGGAVGSATNAMMTVGLDDLRAGRLDAAEVISAEALQLCDAHGYGLMAWPFHLIRMIAAARRGQEHLVREQAVRVTAWAAPRGVRAVARSCSWAQATLAIGNGDFEEAYRHGVAVTPPGVLPPGTLVGAGISLELIESALRTGRRDEAAAHVRAIVESGLDRVSPAFSLTTLTATALVAADDTAPTLFARALAVPGAKELGWDYARAQLFYGERLRRVRAVAAARQQLTAALTAFEQMGATPWVARANRELDATAAARTQTRKPGQTPLTPQEMQVAALAATGHSNRQIGERLLISHRTVGAHLSSVYDKLGVHTRTALRTALGDFEDTGVPA